MKNIVVVGYPKSGSTWLTRLVGELISCPVSGFWKSSHDEIAIEGLNRVSDYRCYKSHHQHHELFKDKRSLSKVVYVLRDPRDVLVSGLYYFGLTPNKKVQESLLLRLAYKAYFNLGGKQHTKQEMLQAILFGNKRLSYWCRVSWKDHVAPYQNDPTVLKIRYESLMADPQLECRNILDFLGIQRSSEDIDRAIDRQSFDKVKSKFIITGDRRKSGFLRKGVSGDWKNHLNPADMTLLHDHMKTFLLSLGYL